MLTVWRSAQRSGAEKQQAHASEPNRLAATVQLLRAAIIEICHADHLRCSPARGRLDLHRVVGWRAHSACLTRPEAFVIMPPTRLARRLVCDLLRPAPCCS